MQPTGMQWSPEPELGLPLSVDNLALPPSPGSPEFVRELARSLWQTAEDPACTASWARAPTQNWPSGHPEGALTALPNLGPSATANTTHTGAPTRTGGRSLWQLSEQEVADLPHPEFATRLVEEGLTPAQAAQFKALRRRVKNRKSARLCSRRKRARYAQMNADVQDFDTMRRDMQTTMHALRSENDVLRSETAKLRRRWRP